LLRFARNDDPPQKNRHSLSQSAWAAYLSGIDNNRKGGDPMKRILSVAIVALTAGSLTACYSPEERALGGAAIGGAAGAIIGGAATGRVGGALVGGVIGAAGGALVGAATAPRVYCPPRRPYLRRDAYGDPYCSRW
jgi:osmotically inducible lipoprotein OsmB